MRASILSASVAVSVGVSALPHFSPATPLAPALPLNLFDTPKFVVPLSLESILNGEFPKPGEIIQDIENLVVKPGEIISNLLLGPENEPENKPANVPENKPANVTENVPQDRTQDTASLPLQQAQNMNTQATCSNPRIRTEWDSYSDSDRQAFINAIRCLMNKPANGQFSQAKSRYEDLVALHQVLTPNVHGSSKFLIWHRYYLWTFEDLLRSECGFDRNLPWWDETRYSGRFADSSVFSSQWFGGVKTGGNCVTDGQFANLALNIGPGTSNSVHCLSRNNDDSKTANTNSQMVNGCNDQGDFASMASCAEGSAHAWGHNGIGAVMQDTFGSPGDPTFWLHHAFIDRNFRIWQNKFPNRVNTINGKDKAGNPLTLDTTVNVYDIRPTIRIGDILDTTGTALCYKYDY